MTPDVHTPPLGLRISPFEPADEQELFEAFAEAVAEGGAFPRRPPADRATFRAAWLEGMTAVWVAHVGDRLAGGYFIRPAFPGTASHIGNAGYLVARDLRGRGIGRTLCEHSLEEARRHGFDAMLFQLVLESNPSRGLWERLGFVQVGRVPEAVEGEAALSYWRRL